MGVFVYAWYYNLKRAAMILYGPKWIKDGRLE